jgi:histidine triad (HIT) family protein
MMSCLFCRIAEKKIISRVVYEDERVFAFEDVNPQAPVHILIIPKEHISTALEIAHKDNELIGHMFQIANKIAEEKGIAQRGFRIVMNCNPEAGQTIYHLHLHLLAGRPMHWPPG